MNYFALFEINRELFSVGTIPPRRFISIISFSFAFPSFLGGWRVRFAAAHREARIESIARGSEGTGGPISGFCGTGRRCIPAHRSPAKAEIKINKASSPPGNIPADARYSATGPVASSGARGGGRDREFGERKESRTRKSRHFRSIGPSDLPPRVDVTSLFSSLLPRKETEKN